jgi:phage baseplate assembly protein W
MATNSKIYSDLDLTFLRQPASGDVSMTFDEQAVIRSIRNLLSTNLYERLFQPNLGSTISQILFEPVSPLSASQIEAEIKRIIENFEPRATITNLFVSAMPDQNYFSVSLYVLVGNRTSPTSINLILERSR